MNHEQRSAKGRTVNKEPTLTDQSQAQETMLNVILARYVQSNQAPGNAQQPLGQEFDSTELPSDLRGFIEMSRSLEEHRQRLPPQLRDIPTEDLLYMTPEALNDKLKPATPQPGLQPENAPSGAK